MFTVIIISVVVVGVYSVQCRLERERVEECRVANQVVEQRIAEFMKNKENK
jgi:hypothetical protein